MNRLKIVVISLLCAISLFFTGCLNLFYDSDKKRSEEHFANFINSINEKDVEYLNSLFAKNKIAELEKFDDEINDLFVYVKGNIIRYNVSTPSALNDSDNNIKKKWLNISADVETTEEKYRFAICWCDTDTGDRDNEGIWSLYVFNYKDNPLEDYTFYGGQSWIDLQWQTGINIVKPYKYGEMTLNIIESGNVDYIKLLFATEIINASEFEESLDKLKSYYNVKHTKVTQTALKKEEERGEDGQVKAKYEMHSYEVETQSGNYYIALKYCDKSDNELEIGINSLYVCKAEQVTESPYWGDGLWTDGIHIGVN